MARSSASTGLAIVPAVHDAGRDLFDARQLHAWLGIGKHFSSWFPERVKEYGFQAVTDFYPVSGKTTGPKGGRPGKDYLVTRDMAKELAMVERTDKGRMTRRYFIAMESAAVSMATTLAAQGQAGGADTGPAIWRLETNPSGIYQLLRAMEEEKPQMGLPPTARAGATIRDNSLETRG